MHVSPHYPAVCLVDNNWFLWWGWYDAMKNSYFSVQGEILWLAHYDVTIRIYLCCPYFGETVRRGEGLLHTHRTISRLGMGRASNRFIALSKWIFAVKYFMGGSLQSSQQPATLWLQLRTHPLIEKPSWLINWWWMILSLGASTMICQLCCDVHLHPVPAPPGRIFLWSLSNTRRDPGRAGPVMGTSFQT